MSTATQLIRSSTQRPVRLVYIKRRDSAGNYEADWVRIDWANGINRVVDWGKVSIKTDSTNGVINDFTISDLQLKYSLYSLLS